MTKFIYTTIIRSLLFYTLVDLFNGVTIGVAPDWTSEAVVSLLFGLASASIPFILKFFKLKTSKPSQFFMALIVNFLFMFMLYTEFLGLGKIESTRVLVTGITVIDYTAIQTLVVLTVLLSVAILFIPKQEK